MDSYLQGENFFYKPTDRSPKSRTTQAGWHKPRDRSVHGKFQQRNTCTSPTYSISVYLLVLVPHSSSTYLFEGAFAGRQFYVRPLILHPHHH